MPEPDETAQTVAAEIRKVKEAAAAEPRARNAEEVLPLPRQIAPARPPIAPAPDPEAPPLLAPTSAEVNRLWTLAHAQPPRGVRGWLFGWVRRLLAPLVEAQVAFNSRQVQLDNQLLEYLETRFARTHGHYDHVLGQYGLRLNDADERHRILERELVAHVHDLVQRIDLVLAESERGRVSLESGLRDVRARLLAIEERARR